MVPVQEALAFAGVQQRPAAPPKPEAPKPGGMNNITAREVSKLSLLRLAVLGVLMVAKLAQPFWLMEYIDSMHACMSGTLRTVACL